MTESAQKQFQVHKNAQKDNKKRIKVFDDRGTRAWADVPNATEWVEELRGNDTPEVTMEVPCKTDPRAPHGFNRNASFDEDRYVCDCEFWEPDVDKVDMSEERVHKSDKFIHEPFAMDDAKDRLIRIMGTFDLATGHADTMDQALDSLEEELRDVLGHLRARREWVGLSEDEFEKILETHNEAMPFAIYLSIEAKLKEKNGG